MKKYYFCKTSWGRLVEKHTNEVFDESCREKLNVDQTVHLLEHKLEMLEKFGEIDGFEIAVSGMTIRACCNRGDKRVDTVISLEAIPDGPTRRMETQRNFV